MTSTEIQQYINNKDYDKFLGDDTSLWMSIQADNLINLNFTPDFFKWMFQKSIYNHWSNIVSAPFVFENMTYKIYNPSLDEIKYFIDFLPTVNMMSFVGSFRFHDMRRYPIGTYDYILSKGRRYDIDLSNFLVRAEHIDALSDEGRSILAKYLTDTNKVSKYYNKLRGTYTSIGWDNVIKIVGKEKFKEFIVFVTHQKRVTFRKFESINDAMSPEEIFQWIDELYEIKSILLQYIPKYFNNSKIDFSDDVLNKLIEYNNNHRITIHEDSLKKFTKEQFAEMRYMKTRGILMTKDGTLEDYAELTNSEEQAIDSESIIRHGRYTEEQMLKYPHIFSPEHLNNSSGLYFSKETLQVLNKAHGKRQRYYEEDQTLNRLMLANMRNRESCRFDLDYFLYLIEKTKASNEDIIKSLILNFDKPNNNPLEKFSPIVKLIKDNK